MKKVLSFLIALCMIASLTAVCTFSSAAADDTLVFSFTEASAKPGDTVDITINIDKNPGFWSLGFILYHSDKLTLRDISYGTLTPENYYFNSDKNVAVDSLGSSSIEAIQRVGVNTDGLRTMLIAAIYEDSVTDNIMGTGKLLTLSFEVSAGAPAGDYTVGATIKDSGDFVDAITLAEVPVSFANTGKITVGGDDVATDPDANFGTPSNPDAAGSNGYYEQHPEYAPGNQSPAETSTSVKPQTDEKGNAVTDANGQIVPAETEPEEYRVVTDNSGEIVYETDADGNRTPKTEKVVDISKTEDKNNDKEGSSAKTAAIIIGVVLVCAGAAGIIFVFATRNSSGKSDSTDDENKAESADKDDKSDEE